MSEELLIECDPENGHLCDACNPPHGTWQRYVLGDEVTRHDRGDGRNELVGCRCEPCTADWRKHERYREYQKGNQSGERGAPQRAWEPPMLSTEWKRLGACAVPTVPCPEKPKGGDHTECLRCNGTWEVNTSDLFFPGRGFNLRPAQALCESCVVQKECLIWGSHYEEYGIWGGCGERRRIRFRNATGIKKQNLVEVFAGR